MKGHPQKPSEQMEHYSLKLTIFSHAEHEGKSLIERLKDSEEALSFQEVGLTQKLKS